MKILDSESFKDYINSEEKVIVDFYADWCGPCRAMNPLLEQVDSKNPGKIAKINVDQEPEIASQFGIRSIPTMLVFQKSMLVERKTGAPRNSEEIATLLA